MTMNGILKCSFGLMAIVLFVAGSASAQGRTGEVRESAAIPKSADGNQVPSGIGVLRVHPRLRFDRPVFLTGCGDGSGRIFVVEQGGVIRVFRAPAPETGAEAKDTSVFLDLRDRVSRRGNEEGLLGLAFHPRFKENGEFFVHYSSKRDQGAAPAAPNVIARYRVSKDGHVADETSEEILLTQAQPYPNHNGGMLAFGPDGFLYASLGDGGAANDPHGNGQNLNSLLGSILRIDVNGRDPDRNYRVPGDNPFVGRDDARPEIFAFGLRNVWRFSFDRTDGTIIAGDVGQDRVEEIDVITKGGNYGWNRFEATLPFRSQTKLAMEPAIAPVASYGRSLGISVTGGYVYRGQDHPSLNGIYFYGDYVSGNLWALRRDQKGAFTSELVRRTGRSIASFGEDDRAELYLLSFDGGLYRVVPSAPEDSLSTWPKKLSETGLFASMRKRAVAAEVIAYEVSAPFWSDGADKERFLALPEGKKLTYRSDGAWTVPVGSTLIKTFAMKGRRGSRALETRLIRRTSTGWEAATYIHDVRSGDAELAPEGRQFELYGRTGVTTWHGPSSSECASCHVESSGFVLGLTTAQLNREVDGRNQIEALRERGVLAGAEEFHAEDAPRFRSPFDEAVGLTERVRTYLDVNCAMCHRPEGPGNASIDLRFGTSIEKTRLLNEAPAQGDMGLIGARLVAPGDPERSILLHRVSTLGSGRMPNLGSNVVDAPAVALIRAWIESLPKGK